MHIPPELHYTESHEWVRAEGANFRIGITDFAEEALGDVVFVDLPTVGAEFAAGAVLGEVESTKSVSEIYASVAGRIVEINAELTSAPEQLNADPYGDGWLCVLAPADASQDELLDASAYEKLIGT